MSAEIFCLGNTNAKITSVRQDPNSGPDARAASISITESPPYSQSSRFSSGQLELKNHGFREKY